MEYIQNPDGTITIIHKDYFDHVKESASFSPGKYTSANTTGSMVNSTQISYSIPKKSKKKNKKKNTQNKATKTQTSKSFITVNKDDKVFKYLEAIENHITGINRKLKNGIDVSPLSFTTIENTIIKANERLKLLPSTESLPYQQRLTLLQAQYNSIKEKEIQNSDSPLCQSKNEILVIDSPNDELYDIIKVKNAVETFYFQRKNNNKNNDLEFNNLRQKVLSARDKWNLIPAQYKSKFKEIINTYEQMFNEAASLNFTSSIKPTQIIYIPQDTSTEHKNNQTNHKNISSAKTIQNRAHSSQVNTETKHEIIDNSPGGVTSSDMISSEHRGLSSFAWEARDNGQFGSYSDYDDYSDNYNPGLDFDFNDH